MPEASVARVSEFQNGQMQQVSVGDTDVLLSRVDDQFYAVAAHCTHYGAPLADGVLHGSRVVCPWHHACFDVRNGHHLEPPGCDGLPTFKVRVEDDEVFVHVPEDAPTQVTPPMAQRQPKNDRTFVVLGGGAAGAFAAEAMRTAGFTGRVVLVSAEKELPYDRINNSKAYLQGEMSEDQMPLRPADFYRAHDIELMLGRPVARLDAAARQLTFDGGETLAYDGLVLCSGSRARKLSLPGADLHGVFTLRSRQDSQAIREAAQNAQRAVVVGASFIGLEGAGSLRKLGCEVTVVAPDEVPFAKLWGERVGKMLQQKHEATGIQFQLETEVERFEGQDGHVVRVVLKNGNTLPADLVLVGIGVEPNTGFVHGVPKEEDGGLRTDEHLRVTEGFYAAGDIAHVPYRGGTARIEHWRVAAQHGRRAGYHLADHPVPYNDVPFFWSAQQGMQLRYVGHAEGFDRIVYDGAPEEGAFVAFYVKDDRVQAALGLKRDADMAALRELMRLDQVPAPDALEGGFDLQTHLSQQATDQ